MLELIRIPNIETVMQKYTQVPANVTGLFWLHQPDTPTQPVFVRESLPGAFLDVQGQEHALPEGAHLIGPQTSPSTQQVPVRAQSTIKLDGSFAVDCAIKSGNCLISGVNEALSLAGIPIVVIAFPK